MMDSDAITHIYTTKFYDNDPYWNKNHNEVQRAEDIYNKLINEGKQAHRPSITNSIKDDLPYICYTETEYDRWHNDFDKPLLSGYVPGLLNILDDYVSYSKNNYYAEYNVWKNPEKANDMIRFFKEQAEKGYLVYQAALIGRNMELLIQYFTKEELQLLRNKYERQIHENANRKDPAAIYAVAMFLIDSGTQYKIDYLTESAELGYGDAWYEMPNALVEKYMRDNQENFAKNGYSLDGFKCNKVKDYYQHAARCDNGVMAPYCQYLLGRALFDGDGYFNGEEGLGRDFEQARYWFQKSASKNFKSAVSYLENFEEYQQHALNKLNQNT